MLVISRDVGQAIRVGDDIEVLVTAIDQRTIELVVTRLEVKGRLTTELTHRLARDEQIDLSDECTCAVMDIRPPKVRLGITAPKTMSVHRKEVWEAIRRETGGDA